MSQLALYRAWRPRTFAEVVGQNHVVDALKQSVKSGDFAHAFLFCGSRGTGKTSVAKIFAQAVNCLAPVDGNPCRHCEICTEAEAGRLLDIVEIDAASNNSVDNIRRLTDEINFMPATAKFKVYIIDEVHMLSTGAFNALLKTLEEPPQHVIFILATTEAHRIPQTISSRCQRFDFRRIGNKEIEEQLARIAKHEEIPIQKAAIKTIVSLADGALRDAISILDQASTAINGEISTQDILALTGMVGHEFLAAITRALCTGNLLELMQLSSDIRASGRDLQAFVNSWAAFLRDVLLAGIDGSGDLIADRGEEAQRECLDLARIIPAAQLIDLVRKVSGLAADLKYASNKQAVLDVGLISLASEMDSLEELALQVESSSRKAPKSEPQSEAKSELQSKEPKKPLERSEPSLEKEQEARAEVAPEEVPAALPEEKAEPAALPEELASKQATPAALEEKVKASEALPKEEAAPESLAEDLATSKAITEEEAAPETITEDEAEAAPSEPKAEAEPSDSKAEAKSKAERPKANQAAISPPLPEAPPEARSLELEDLAPEPYAREAKVKAAESKPTEEVAKKQAKAEQADAAKKPKAKAESLAKAAAAGAEKQLGIAIPKTPRPSPDRPEEVWEEAMRELQRIPRIDLKMLLSPAVVNFSEGLWKIRYTGDQKAIYQAVSKADNLDVIRQAVEKAVGGAAELSIELTSEGEFSHNLNPDEPAWVHKVREIARKNDLKLRDD
ncbi:MAG: DNA polymerase III subunit gamma/tau [Eubacteriales bacterium]|nr:DNA polymerase III subunit gamma/tau [Eubacteriales bacterium]